MNRKEIRDNCYQCGNRCLMLIEPAPIATDYCELAQLDCSMILVCDPTCRIPKTKRVQSKKAVRDV
jgi:hypothetical protein